MIKTVILSAGLIAATGICVGMVGSANASTQIFEVSNFNSGDVTSSSNSTYTLNVLVDFTPSAGGNLTIQIFNTSTMLSDAEGVFGVDFSMYDASNIIMNMPSLNDNAPVGQQWSANNTDKKSTTYIESSNSPALANNQLASSWKVQSFGSGVYGISVSSSKPHDLVIGSPINSSGKTTANASVYQHSPSLVSGAVFTLSGITELNASTIIKNVNVIYGTSNQCTGPLKEIFSGPNSPSPVPIPATLPLLGGGLFGLGLIALHKRRRHCVK